MIIGVKANDAGALDRLLGMQQKLHDEMGALWEKFLMRIPIDNERMNQLQLEHDKLHKTLTIAAAASTDLVYDL